MSKLPRSLWLTNRFLGDRLCAAVHARAEALGEAVHEELLDTGDRLASISVTLAQRCYRRAAAAWTRFGPDGFRRWVALGEELATADPSCRDGAMAYFAVPVTGFGPSELEMAATWCQLGREVAATSRKLAAVFFKTTAVVLRRPDAMERLRKWATVGVGLYGQRGWQGEFLAQAYFAAAPRATLTLNPSLYQVWAGAGAAIYPAMREREFFGNLPRELHAWADDDRERFLRTTLALATASPKHAAIYYRDLPGSLRQTSAPVREMLLRVLARAAKCATAVADFVPVAGAVLLQVPEERRIEALTHVDRAATDCPDVTVACLRALPQVYEEASPPQVREWFASGMAVAADNLAAGLAYFALESRTSLKVLRACSTAATLEESQGVLRKYIQMLSGAPASLHGVAGTRLSLPIEEFPAENTVSLPLRIDHFETHEENFRLYRFLAAQLAGRREFGTYDFVPDGAADPEAALGSALRSYLDDDHQPPRLEDFFLLAEGVRVYSRLCAAYAGLAKEGRWIGAQLLARVGPHGGPDWEQVLDGLFSLALAGGDFRDRPAWLPAPLAELVLRLVAPLSDPNATVQESMRVAHALARALEMPALARARRGDAADGILLDKVAGDALIDPYFGDDDAMPAPGEAPHVPSVSGPEPGGASEDTRLELDQVPDDGVGGSQPISPEELKRLLDAGVKLRIAQAAGDDVDGIGLYITDLIGKIPSEQLEELRQLLSSAEERSGRLPRRWLKESAGSAGYYYDEWDYQIGDYRNRWCRLQEVTLEPDAGEFYQQTLADYATLIPEVRRQFQRIRPEMYRQIRGLEDGEDFDLNAVINARVEARAGRAPSNKLYLARKREERDVATLFLVDMSASTDEPLVNPPPAALPNAGEWLAVSPRRSQPAKVRRIIDVTKAALVIMTAALEEIGDAYAIYGFSGHGREHVEFYRVKSFAEALNPAVKGRMAGIEPKRSTRMGTALRHAVEKMAAVAARSKHLFLLSDGFPQDFDYGQDRRSNVYGIRDTAVALREAQTAGITPFCITVDKAGHDYLRQMCDESRYMVIDDIAALPRELPKIYQRVVRA